MKRILFILTAATVFLAVDAMGQSVQLARKYRVIAVKKGNPGITSMSNETEVIPTMYFYVPGAFTPNGDGINDTFGIQGESIAEFTIQIYNRWGQLVYESQDATATWDGTYKGYPAPQGTYVYKVTASSATGRRASKEGTVSLIQ